MSLRILSRTVRSGMTSDDYCKFPFSQRCFRATYDHLNVKLICRKKSSWDMGIEENIVLLSLRPPPGANEYL
jgi:hypothetical protein